MTWSRRGASLPLCLLLAGASVRAQDAPAPSAPAPSATPGLQFEYRSSTRSGPSRAFIDVAIQAHSADADAALWIAAPDSAGAPDPALVADGLRRWRVGPLDRFKEGETRRVVLLLRPIDPCRPGTALWAEVSVNGSWLPAERRGKRTLGGTVADCSEPMLLVDVLSVEQRK